MTRLFEVTGMSPDGGLPPYQGVKAEVIVALADGQESAEAYPYHVGPLNGSGGFRASALVVHFHVDSPSPWYQLSLEVYVPFGPAQPIDITVNERRGRCYTRPRRTDRARVLHPSPLSAWGELEVVVPGDALRSGPNSIELRLASDALLPELGNPPELPPTRLLRPHWWFGVVYLGCRFDAVEPRLLTPSASVTTTPLIVRGACGPERVIAVELQSPHPWCEAKISISAGDVNYDVTATSEQRDFGEWRFPIRLPERTSGALELRVEAERFSAYAEVDLPAARRHTVHVVPHVHFDLGYTGSAAKAHEVALRNVDTVLEMVQSHPGFRFFFDAGAIEADYRKRRTASACEELTAAIESGAVVFNGAAYNNLFGLMSLGEMYRSAYPGSALVAQVDVPSLPSSVPWALADSGVRFLLCLANHRRGQNRESDKLHTQSPFWWEDERGRRLLVNFADGFQHVLIFAGDPPTLPGLEDSLVRLLSQHEERSDLTDIALWGWGGNNEMIGYMDPSLIDRWNEVLESPSLRWSTPLDYFEQVVSADLPVLRGDAGSFWEEGAGAAAATLSTYRAAQRDIEVAEALAAIAQMVDDRFTADLDVFRGAWDALAIASEHTWSVRRARAEAGAGTDRRAVDEKTALLAAARIKMAGASDQAMFALALHAGFGEQRSVVVCNSTPWARSDIVELVLDEDEVLTVDGQPLSEVGRELTPGGTMIATVVVEDVPAVGYRVCQVGKGVPARPDSGHRAIDVAIEGNELLLNWMGKSVFDGSWSVADVLRVTPADPSARSKLIESDWFLPEASLGVVRAERTLRDVNVGSQHAEYVFDSAIEAWLPRIETTVRVQHARPTIDVTVRLEKARCLTHEAVYIAFPFKFVEPEVRFERPHRWVDARRELLPGTASEWIVSRGGFAVSDNDWCAELHCLDTPIVAVGDVVRGSWPEEIAPPCGRLFSWPFNNYWPMNYPAFQEGTFEFRYRIELSRSFDAALAARHAREFREPLQALRLFAADGVGRRGPSRQSSWSALASELAPNIDVTFCVGAKGEPLIRVHETVGRSTTVDLATLIDTGSSELVATDPYGQDAAPLEGTVRLKPHDVMHVAARRRRT